MSEHTNTAASLGAPTPMTPAQSHSEIQGLLRDEIAALQDMLEARFKEIAVLTGLLEETGAAQKGIEPSEMAALESRHSVEKALLRAQIAVLANAPKAGIPPFEKQLEVLETAALFDAAWYLQTYPDIAASNIPPKEHYLRAGALEGRNPGPNFDTMAYYFANPDVADMGWPALAHYMLFGQSEGRALV